MDAAVVTLLDLPGLRARELAEPGFGYALAAAAESLGLDPSYILAVMSLESGVRPDAVNPHGGASGLIQFMPATATLVGTTVEELRRMTAIEQLPFVVRFYQIAGRAIRPDVPGDYYMATYHPALVGADAGHVIAVKGDADYDANPGLDANHDGQITVSDVWSKIDSVVAQARTRPMVTSKKKVSSSHRPVVAVPVAVALRFYSWGQRLQQVCSGNVAGRGANSWL